MGLLMAGGLIVAVLILQLLLPWLLLAGGLAIAGWLWRRRRRKQRQYYRVFYELLRRQGGRISALDFAMAAQLTSREARRFLDDRARDFCGNFEPMEAGDILYSFSGLGGAASPEASPRPLQTRAQLVSGDAVESLELWQLAARLNCSVALLQEHIGAADFVYWSQAHDPDKRAWRVDPDSKRCYPIAPSSPHS